MHKMISGHMLRHTLMLISRVRVITLILKISSVLMRIAMRKIIGLQNGLMILFIQTIWAGFPEALTLNLTLIITMLKKNIKF